MEAAIAVPDKCPLTQKPFETPVPIPACSRTCIFEKLAIKDYILQQLRRSGGQPIRCPNPGCQTFIHGIEMINESRTERGFFAIRSLCIDEPLLLLNASYPRKAPRLHVC